MRNFFKSLWLPLGGSSSSQWADDQSISSEIFGQERLHQHAHSLAISQKVSEDPPTVYSIIDRLSDNAIALSKAHTDLSRDSAQGLTVTPAAEWLIDNYHLVEEQIRQTQADLPQGFYRQLPKLADGPLAGHPRIFGLVWAYVAHTDSRFDPASLEGFVNAYQQVDVLTIGELWAVAISLRLVLIENLRRISHRIISSRKDRARANAFADEVLTLEQTDASFPDIFGRLGQTNVTRAFAVQLILRLRDHDGASVQALTWLDSKTKELGYSTETAVNEEHLRQATANVTVRNIITSLRLVADVNWETWFDSVSHVDALLRTTPSYGEMDFPSRTIYRTAVEELARGSAHSEIDVATKAIEASGDSGDCGYHLVGPGRATLEASLNFRAPILKAMTKALRGAGLAGYLGAFLLLTAAVLVPAAVLLASISLSAPLIVLVVLLAIIPVSDVALAIVNFTITRLIDASALPGFALRNGVPVDLRTLVVIPTLLTSHEDIEELVDRLEIHFLSNDDGELYFALLTDWTDSATEHSPNDEALLNAALAGIDRMNLRHGTDRFLVLHRRRLWNEQQGKWMGWERKRGKLHELNRLLRGAEDTSFMVIGGRLPAAIKFVLTLDADTKLPRDAARRLVGKMAHPLNRPQIDDATKTVTRGYGVMQPRVTPSLPVGHDGSSFQKVYSSTRGIDPYAFAISDVYQDLFSEGSFAGKGIYDIDAFEAALANRIPENTLLSHDLFEGIFSRSALVTDIEVVEEFPERYSVAAAREHRWVRGDWQLLPWVGQALRGRGSIDALGLWKMFDNLRRSLSAPSMVASFLLAWFFLPGTAAMAWTLFLAILSAVPALLPAVSGALPREHVATMESRLKAIVDDFVQALSISGLNLVFLADRATTMADAIVRTLYRLYVSRKNLLEWTTAAQVHVSLKSGVGASYVLMASSVIFALLALVAAILRPTSVGFVASPFALAWLLAPAIANLMSQSRKFEDVLEASPDDRRKLRLIARRTWKYFETFVTAADNMLPPDNLQETPKPTLARRTSPTNIGLYLLSIASAREFGWLGLDDTLKKIEATIATLKKLEKYRGHLYNWYDTASLVPLEPKYVSTVDSGNLAGHLIALSHCLSHWALTSIEDHAYLNGMADGLHIVEDELASLPAGSSSARLLKKQVSSELAAFHRLLDRNDSTPDISMVRLIGLAVQAGKINSAAQRLSVEIGAHESEPLLAWAKSLQDNVESHLADYGTIEGHPADLAKRIAALNADVRELALLTEFGFLLDPQRLLFSIGYRVAESMRDESCYDMLASEARLASFFAIAKGDLRTRHWFRLGRTITAVKGGAALVSWSGSMFEYLMPSLVMRAPNAGLLGQTMELVVRRQIDYAKGFGIPWGISESAFNARDIEFTYQYSNFGVPGLGLKRGLADNLVIAPYATGLAAMVSPNQAARNYEKLAQAGAAGSYGFYESLDYTPGRLRQGETVAVVKSYFAHHQGMTIVSLLNAVKEGVMRDRFHQEPMIKASELLLQERAPREVPQEQKLLSYSAASMANETAPTPASRRFEGLSNTSPTTHLLSNGQYSVMLAQAGSGYSTWNGLALTRWREDGVLDDWGSFAYLRDRKAGKVWSAGYMPVAANPDNYVVNFSEDKAEFTRRDGNITTTMECVVSPEDGAEARRITLSNTGIGVKEIEFTSYSELVLSPAAADTAHPAFSKLFVTTEYVPELETLLATRRKRSPSDPNIWVGQFMVVKGNTVGDLEIETDRARFLGQGRSSRMPAAMLQDTPLSGTVGAVLDPVFSMRRRFRVPAGRQLRFTLWTVAAETREGVLDLVDRHRQISAYDRASTLAWSQAQIQLRHLSISVADAHLYQTLASNLIYANSALRSTSNLLPHDSGVQSILWQAGISGDRPIMLVRIDDVEDIAMVTQLLNAFVYWRTKRLKADLVILNDRMSSYVQDLQVEIDARVRKIDASKGAADGLGEVFTLRTDLMSQDLLRILPGVARAVLYARRGTLATQMARLERSNVGKLGDVPKKTYVTPAGKRPTAPSENLEFPNSFGGFSNDGREYVVNLSHDHVLPAPWVNVVANPDFGFQASADGGGYTWSDNSRENKLTTWTNDPVTNRPSEVVYVQDEADGQLYSPTFAPLRSNDGLHRSRHGFGYTIYERETRNLQMEMLQLVPLNDTIKISRLKITNKSDRSAKLVITHFAEWVLGDTRGSTSAFLNCTADEATAAVLVRNPWSTSGTGLMGFVDMAGAQTAWTGDRREFLGTYGTLSNPQSLAQNAPLSSRTTGGADPCTAMQTRVTVDPGQTVEVSIFLGSVRSNELLQKLLTRYRSLSVDSILADVKEHWKQTLEQVQVKTPDRSMDIMLNGWLLYQTLGCRMWARSGFYQASGAYGFRDQLQDSMALISSRPEITRHHILKAAGRQFVEGDLQHWWLPATGAGVRTRISDDVVWLANCVQHYIQATGDLKILDETSAFLEGQQLVAGEHDVYFLPTISDQSATLYEHCARALDRSLTAGAHGLPLFGTGDWNDGMNRVGEQGRGESVWLGWFLYATLQSFIPIAEARGDKPRVAAWQARATSLQKALEERAWDGKWYRRGYYDDGTPLGSSLNDACQIDAIAQSWSAISGAANIERAKMAMEESHRQLVSQSDGLMRLFTPPFDKTSQEPGYIKGYPAGIRENGGQYTHGVIWSIFASAKLGQPARAMELFSMFNPINHAKDEAAARNYRVEPYVITADVYSVAPHVGRGGWTWYTGSAGMMYRAGIEAILGLTREGNKLRVRPCVPANWNEYEVTTRIGNTSYVIKLSRSEALHHDSAIIVEALAGGEYLISLSDTVGVQNITLPLVTKADE
jgi:cyclic beta-1,2-glucan synthetase